MANARVTRATPWGDLEVADAHVHFFSHGFFASLAAQAGRGYEDIARALPDWRLPGVDPGELADVWAAELDRAGVARSALIGSVHGDEASVAAAVARHPGRFAGYFLLNPCAPDSADRARAAFGAGLRAVCLFPAMHAYPLHDERVERILAIAAQQPGRAVFVHCGVLSVGVRKRLGIPSPFDMRFSNPIDLHAVALRHPELTFIVPHFGAGYFREALMAADLCPNVYLDTSSSNSWTRYFTPPPTLAEVFRQALEVAGPRRLLFGTDSSFFPRGWHAAVFDAQAAALREIGADEGTARTIFGGNFNRLFAV